jgi:transcriptional regulator with XRE-family HTH domain
MDAAGVVRMARERRGLSLRHLGRLAGTSHSTLSAYEAGDKVPSVATLIRIVRAAGFALDLELSPVAIVHDRAARGRELVDALELADRFPARPERRLTRTHFGPT